MNATATGYLTPPSPAPYNVENPAKGRGEGFILRGFTLKGR